MPWANGSAPRWLLAVLTFYAGAYFLSLFFRTVSAILAPEFEADLNLDASALGLLAAAYFLGFALAQLPVGLALDAYGPRMVQAVLLSVAGIGVLLSSVVETLPLLLLARLLIGAGFGGCLMSAYQVANLWASPRLIPALNSLVLAAGGLGAVAATAPLASLLSVVTWREIFVWIAGAILLLLIGTLWVTPQIDRRPGPTPFGLADGLRTVVRNPMFRRYLPITAICFGAGTAFQTLWTATWLRDVAGYDEAGVAWLLALMAVALTFGSVAGGLAVVMGERFGVRLHHVVLACAVLFVAAQIGVMAFPTRAAPFFWLIFALTYNPATLSYALVAMDQPRTVMALSNALMNATVIFVTFCLQYGVGLALGLLSDRGAPEAFGLVFRSLLMLEIAALLWCIAPSIRRRFN